MRQVHGQEIMVNEMRLAASAMAKRLAWSLGFGVGVCALTVLLFSPQDLLGNVLAYGWYSLVFEVRQLPILGIRPIDIHNVAQNYALMMHQVWFWQVLLCVFFVFSLGLFAILSWVFWRRGRSEQLDNFKRGAQLVSPKIHNKIMKASYSRKPPHEMGAPLKLGEQGVIVPEALQYRHFAFAGASGYGKSTAIEEIVVHARQQSHKALIVDLNGAFFAKFARPGDRLLSLRDARTLAWDFWHEPMATPENIAAAIIEADATQNQFFWKGARQVLAALLRMNSSLTKLVEDLERPQPQLKERLKAAGELALKVIGEGSGDQADGVMGTTVLDLSFSKQLAENNAGRAPFSVTEWMNDPRDQSWVFLTVDDAGLEVSKPILRVWFELACLAALARNPLQGKHPHTWLIIDEAKSIGQLPSLPAILDKGRKHNVSVVLGFQAFSQVKRIYGEHDANSIFQGLQNQFFFRMTDVECARYASDVLGEQDVEQASYGMSFGIEDSSDRGTINHSRTRRKVVLPEEIRNQEILQAYAKLCHHQPVQVSFSVTQAPMVNRHFVPVKMKQPDAAQSAEFGMYSGAQKGGA